MVYVPGGLTFPTGPDDAGTATVPDAFWVGETEVTYELWSSVVKWAESHGYEHLFGQNEGIWHGQPGFPGTGGANQPVTAIQWRDAMVFSNAITEWYNAIHGTDYTCAYYHDAVFTQPIREIPTHNCPLDMTPGSPDNPYVRPDATGFRLLNNNEWELAARYKGSDNSNGAIEMPVGSGHFWTPGDYASGASASFEDPSATGVVAWDWDNSGLVTHDIKGKAANLLGLFDMSGNADEWVLTEYPGSPSELRSKRGGHVAKDNAYLQVGVIESANSCTSSGGTGLRLGKNNGPDDGLHQ
jgi:formylglycine-generating enzyme required for sulfatase activity